MATATVSADVVIRDGQKELARIIKEREARDEKAICRTMANKKIRYGFLGLKTRTRTREEAISYLEENSFWGWRSQYCENYEIRIKKLIVLAEHGDPLTLNHEDAYALWGDVL